VISGPDTMLQQIEELLIAPSSGSAAPSLARMEDALTEGYAQALALEAERWRLERRLGEVARTLDGPDVSSFAEELSSLAKRLMHADGELSHLRTVLGSLHERTRTMRLAARTAQ
jgi:ABC-type phosphate transport system auxiliary subunit